MRQHASHEVQATPAPDKDYKRLCSSVSALEHLAESLVLSIEATNKKVQTLDDMLAKLWVKQKDTHGLYQALSQKITMRLDDMYIKQLNNSDNSRDSSLVDMSDIRAKEWDKHEGVIDSDLVAEVSRQNKQEQTELIEAVLQVRERMNSLEGSRLDPLSARLHEVESMLAQDKDVAALKLASLSAQLQDLESMLNRDKDVLHEQKAKSTQAATGANSTQSTTEIENTDTIEKVDRNLASGAGHGKGDHSAQVNLSNWTASEMDDAHQVTTTRYELEKEGSAKASPQLKLKRSVSFDLDDLQKAEAAANPDMVDNENLALHAHTWLNSTVWEASFLIGLSDVGRGGNITVAIALFINIAFQLFFALTVAATFPSGPIDSNEMREWRYSVGHHYSQVDSYGRSLVSRVCAGDHTMSVAYEQMVLLDKIVAYTESQSNGPPLCVLVIVIWFLIWLQEFQRIIVVLRETHGIPRSRHTAICMRADLWYVISLSNTRQLFFVLCSAARFAVCTMLFIAGTVWLLFTVSITELVMNGVALAFVFEIDEVIYSCFVPFNVKSMTEQLQVRSALLAGNVWDKFALFFLLFSVAGASIYGVIANSEHMRNIWDISCGGEQDFAVGLHHEMNLMFYAKTIPFDGSLRTEATNEAIDNLIVRKRPKAVPVDDFNMLKIYMAQDVSELAGSIHPGCSDSTFDKLPSLWRMLVDRLGMTRVESCEEVSWACGRMRTHVIRMLCPLTCRCFYPKPSVAISTGCPFPGCQDTVTAGYYDNSLNCTNDPVTSLVTNPHWHSYWLTFNETVAMEKSRYSKYVEGATIYALEFGCSVVAEYPDIYKDVCADSVQFQSVGTYCPESCNCGSIDWWGCPSKCFAGW